MKKKLLDSIDVKTPCNERWEEMKGTEEIRFCSHCAKNVHNISAMTHQKAEKIIKDSNGKLCVRYYKTLEGQLITAPPKLTQIKRQAAITAGVLATSLTFSVLTYAQGAPILRSAGLEPLTTNTPQKSHQKQSSIVSGEIKDEAGKVIAGAKVTLRNVKTGKIRITRSNANGFYEFKDVDPAVYEIEVEAVGYIKLIVNDLNLPQNITVNKTLILINNLFIDAPQRNTETEIKTEDNQLPDQTIQPRELITLPENARTFTMGLVVLPDKKEELKPKTDKTKKKKKKN